MPHQERHDWTEEQRRRVDELIDEYRAALHLQVLRELAQHAGRADILREQVVASRS